MVNTSRNFSNLTDQIFETIRKEKPKTVKQLVYLVQKRYHLSEEEISEHIVVLHDQGKLPFRDDLLLPLRTTFRAYVFSKQASWFWFVVTLAITTTILVFTLSPTLVPFIYVRYLLGSISVLFLPGYSLIKILFPMSVPIPTNSKELDTIERIALSIGVSFALTPIIGFLLNYTTWGIRTMPLTISILTLTLLLATVGIIREYRVYD